MTSFDNLVQQIKDIKSNYEMGFITSFEFVNEYLFVLNQLGAGDDLSRVANETMSGLAQHLIGILNGSGKAIADYNKK